jgi:hypothetical protein
MTRERVGTQREFAARCRVTMLIAGLSALSLLFGPGVWGDTTGAISGVITDSSGAVIQGADITVVNNDTGVSYSTKTDVAGLYSLQALPVGNYDLTVSKARFKRYRQTDIVVTVNAAIRVNASLPVGETSQTVNVASETVQVETENTYLGEVIGSDKMTALPLNGRSYTDLLSLQPGVVPLNSGVNPTGETSPPAQYLNPGNLSISGQRETANAFMINGSLVEDEVQQGAAIIPNLDSIAEFRILSNGYDAEFGEYSGGQVNVLTKSGTNSLHGDAFEFLRNTDLDARNYYSPSRGPFHQNQFGGTVGGPIRHDKVFFFTDYQGTRQAIGVDTGEILVPSAQDRTGNLSDIASSLTGTVTGAGWASVLSQRLGYPVSDGEPYYTPGCTISSTCVFPNAVVPQSAWSAPAGKLLPYIPLPGPDGFFSTSRFGQPLQDDEGATRVDANTRWGTLSGYYYLDNNSLNDPYPQEPIPGFNGLGTQRSQLAQFEDEKTWGFNKVNEFHLNYVRNYNASFVPVGGVGPKISSFGIQEGCSGLGVCVLYPPFEGVPRVDFRNFSIGVNTHTATFIQDTYEVLDGFSVVLGKHTVKFGGQLEKDQVKESNISRPNGAFTFDGGETGSDFADFLIGAPTLYRQGAIEPMHDRTQYFGLYGQDSWRLSSDFTLNYGVRWDLSYPWWEENNELETIIPGKQSATFPGSPLGWVFPGDPGIPKTTSPVRWGNFAPRIGIAYAPKPSEGMWRTLLGAEGTTSIRASFGKFFTQMGEYGQTQIIGDAPYGFFWVSEAPPMFDEPFLARATQTSETQRFPVTFPPLNVSPSHPDNSINWALFEPISSSPGWNYRNVLPYSENYMFSFQRLIGTQTVVTLSYVGSEGHHLLVNLEADPSNPALCLSVSQASEVAPGSPTCGPFSEDQPFVTTSGQTIFVRPLGPGVGSDGLYSTIGHSSYNALQTSVRHHSGRLELLAAYTYGKAMDDASEINDQVNPYNPHLSTGLSAFDITQNFVVSFNYALPFDQLLSPNRLTRGWTLSGITRFSTGLPVTISETDDRALIGDFATGINDETVDEPIFTPGPILKNTNPRSGQPYFNTALFAEETLGEVGNSNRRFFHGPGLNNWDLALLKMLPLTETKSFQFRFEFFNAFNHTQFNNPEGEFTDSTFGLVTSANPPRIGQVALKFLF